MVEVFKTDVTNKADAALILRQIHTTYAYHANFDLQDCDHILRVKALDGSVQAGQLVELVSGLGYNAELLPDDLPQDSIVDMLSTTIPEIRRSLA